MVLVATCGFPNAVPATGLNQWGWLFLQSCRECNGITSQCVPDWGSWFTAAESANVYLISLPGEARLSDAGMPRTGKLGFTNALQPQQGKDPWFTPFGAVVECWSMLTSNANHLGFSLGLDPKGFQSGKAVTNGNGDHLQGWSSDPRVFALTM